MFEASLSKRKKKSFDTSTVKKEMSDVATDKMKIIINSKLKISGN